MPPNAPDSGRFIYPGSTRNSTSPPKRRYQTSPSRGARTNAPMSFFMRSEEEMNRRNTTISPPRPSSPPFAPQVEDSTYGVRSFDSSASYTLSDRTSEESEHSHGISEAEAALMHSTSRSDSPFMPELVPHAAQDYGSTGSSPIPTMTRLTGLLTPLLLRSPQQDSSAGSMVPSTPKSMSIRSLRLSDDDYSVDEVASQALTSSGDGEDEEEQDVEETVLGRDAAEIGTAPQLVMPSIRMPSRRPFTERGKGIGKLKIMVAGAKGVGKTSLIRSIVQICDDIVHVDAMTNPSLSIPRRDTGYSASSQHTDLLRSSTTEITEIPVSTRPYPAWWVELDESKVVRKRRRSMNETILERNLCFIDTPGHESSNSPSRKTIQHVEGLLYRCQTFDSFSDGELLSILSGNGGVQVDVVLYMLKDTPSADELDLLKRLADLTNVIPLIGHADTLTAEEIQALKHNVLAALSSANVRPFLFDQTSTALSSPNILSSSTAMLPYAVSTLPSTDLESMDSSLLMTPDYKPSLVHSDLTDFIHHLFDPNTTAWLRHLSARKFLEWRRRQFGQPTITAASATHNNGLNILNGFPLHNTSSIPASTSNANINNANTTAYPAIPTTSPFTAARLADHTLHEERLTQVRLSRWAADLQRSLRDERERYAALQRGERRRWLTERIRECDEADADARASPTRIESPALGSDASNNTNGHGAQLPLYTSGTTTTSTEKHIHRYIPLDPLGLLSWEERFRGGAGWLVVEVAGACGVLGALAVWAVRSWILWRGGGAGAGSGVLGHGPGAEGEGWGWSGWLWVS